MAISNIANPSQKYMTGYNPIVFVVDSTNKTQTGFRYVFDIYSAGTSNLLASYQIAPRIDDGYGVLFAERVLQDYLTYNFSGSSINIPESWVNYDVQVGESYGSSWIFTDYQFADYTGTTYNGFMELINTGTTHPYIVGESINVTQYSAVSSTLNGIHTIVAVPDANTIVIDIPYDSSNLGFTVSGVTTFANNRRVVYSDLYSYDNLYAINGAVPFTSKFLNQAQYLMSGSSGTQKFLTNLPTEMRKTRTEDLFINLINDESVVAYFLYIENSNGDIFRKLIYSSSQPLVQVKVGPNNAEGTVVSGSLPIIKDTTTWYKFWVADFLGGQISEKITINIDDRCPIDYGTDNGGDISICFLDRLGSFGSFAFQLKRQDNTSIKRDMYYKQFGDVVGGSWNYNLNEFGDSIYNVELNRTLTLNTNWMTESEAQYFDELVSSPVTFIKWNGEYQGCVITDSSYETTYQRNKTLMRKTITIAFANNDTINI